MRSANPFENRNWSSPLGPHCSPPCHLFITPSFISPAAAAADDDCSYCAAAVVVPSWWFHLNRAMMDELVILFLLFLSAGAQRNILIIISFVYSLLTKQTDFNSLVSLAACSKNKKMRSFLTDGCCCCCCCLELCKPSRTCETFFGKWELLPTRVSLLDRKEEKGQ